MPFQGWRSLAGGGTHLCFSPRSLNTVHRLRQRDDRSVFAVHLKEIDEMGGSRAVKDALLDQEDRKTVGVTVQDGAAHATAGAGAGDEKAVDSLAQQIGDQVRPEEGAGPGLAHDELAVDGLDHFRKLGGETL